MKKSFIIITVLTLFFITACTYQVDDNKVIVNNPPATIDSGQKTVDNSMTDSMDDIKDTNNTIENLSINFNTSSDNLTLVGGDRDEHGCIPSAGYTWCEAKLKCLRVFEEDCDMSAEKLSADIKAANTCETDDDCVLVGSKCPFGCYVYVNKADSATIKSSIDKYNASCGFLCANSTGVECVKNVCQPTFEKSKNLCNDNYKNASYCTEQLALSCGTNSLGIQKTYSNPCFACMDGATSWFEGEC